MVVFGNGIKVLAPANNPAIQHAIMEKSSGSTAHSNVFTIMIFVVGLIFIAVILAGRKKR